VFFKIDGDTTAIKPVNGILHLQGNATFVGTPGNHGNLGVQEVDAGQTVAIPKAIGHFETTLTPIPIAGTSLSVASPGWWPSSWRQMPRPTMQSPPDTPRSTSRSPTT